MLVRSVKSGKECEAAKDKSLGSLRNGQPVWLSDEMAGWLGQDGTQVPSRFTAPEVWA